MESRRSNRALLCGLTLLAVSGCATTIEQKPAAPTTTATPPAAALKATPAEPPAIAIIKAAADPKPVASADTAAEAAADSAAADSDTIEGPRHNDVWARIRNGYGLAPLDSNLIARHEQWFMNNPEYMQAMMERARLYLFFIAEEVEKRGMPMEIALLPAIESAYKPYAYSRAKASGLWQFMAPTGRLYGLNMNWWYDERRDVIAATRAALDYLEKLNKDFDGDWHLALAAYNAGEGKISRMQQYNRVRGKSTKYQHLKLKAETIHYVPKLIAMANIVADPEKYGVNLLPIPNEPYFIKVHLDSQVDLGVVARLTDMSVNELQSINPHLNRWATHPEGPHRLLVPVDKKDTLLAGLSELPPNQRVQWLGHEVQRGDTLSTIARRYDVTIAALRESNSLRSNVLSVGQSIMIPVSSRTLAQARVAAAPAAAKSAWRSAGITGPVIHRVRSGETLWSIARRYGVLVSQIVEWNVLDAGDILKLGQRLRIFPIGSKSSPASALADDTPNG
jgi:membrane-bound lytic murein transglycosylase D